MLHILLLILKIIGIIILVLLVLFLLVAGSVMFVPVRYRAHALYDEKACAQAKLSWLLHLVYLKVDFSPDTGFRLIVRIAGITFFDNQKPKKPKVKREKIKKEKTPKKTQEAADSEKMPENAQTPEPEKLADKAQPPEPEQLSENAQLPESAPDSEKAQAHEPETDSENAQPPEQLSDKDSTVATDQVDEEEKSAQNPSEQRNEKQKDEHTINEPETMSFVSQLILKIKNVVNRIVTKIKSIIASIKGFFNRLSSSRNKLLTALSNIGAKKNGILSILTDEQNRPAFIKVKKLVFRILRHLQPTQLSIRLNFGFEDPSTTGYALGLLSLLYPVYTDHIKLYPDFENQVFKGECTARGRLRASVFLFVVCQLIFDKDVRRIIKSFKNV